MALQKITLTFITLICVIFYALKMYDHQGKWAGQHVARMGKVIHVYPVILVGKPDGKRPRGRPR
jgi:hypothetical protein